MLKLVKESGDIMQCRNCGAIIRNNENTCNVCGVSTNIEPNAIIEDVSNPVANEFISPSYMSDATQQMPLNPSLYSNSPTFEPPLSDKKYESKDGNDRVTATAINFVTFAMIIGGFIVLCFILFNIVF